MVITQKLSRLGNLWSIDGTMTSEDNNTSYELHYVPIPHGLRPTTASAGPDESELVH